MLSVWFKVMLMHLSGCISERFRTASDHLTIWTEIWMRSWGALKIPTPTRCATKRKTRNTALCSEQLLSMVAQHKRRQLFLFEHQYIHILVSILLFPRALFGPLAGRNCVLVTTAFKCFIFPAFSLCMLRFHVCTCRGFETNKLHSRSLLWA